MIKKLKIYYLYIIKIFIIQINIFNFNIKYCFLLICLSVNNGMYERKVKIIFLNLFKVLNQYFKI